MASSEQSEIRNAAETIYRNAQRPTVAHNSRYEPCKLSNLLLFIAFIVQCCSNNKEIQLNDAFYCQFSSIASNTLGSMEFCEWGLYSWIHSRWPNVYGAKILPAVCGIRFIFYFNALVHLYYGKQIYTQSPLNDLKLCALI